MNVMQVTSFNKDAAINSPKVISTLSCGSLTFTMGFIFMILAGVADKASTPGMLIGNWVFATLMLVLPLIFNALYAFNVYRKTGFSCVNSTVFLSALVASIIPGGVIFMAFASYYENKQFDSNMRNAVPGYKRNKKPMPHVYVILMSLIFIVIVVSWFISFGQPNSHAVRPAGFFELFLAPINGFVAQAELIIFLLVLGGFLAVVTKTKALEAGLGRLVKKLKGKEVALIPILFILFSVGGTTYGMAEETIPFYLILIPVFLAAGFDIYTGFLVVLLGSGLGVCSSILNPFVVNVAVDAVNDAMGKEVTTDLTVSAGLAWRSVIYVVFLVAGLSYVTWYGWRVKKNKEKSCLYNMNINLGQEFNIKLDDLPEFTKKRKAILGIFGFSFVVMIVSVIYWGAVAKFDGFDTVSNWFANNFPWLGGVHQVKDDKTGAISYVSNIVGWGNWYLVEMTFLFFFASLIIGALDWKGFRSHIDTMLEGARDFMGVAFVLAIAKGISLVSQSSGLDKMLVDGLSSMYSSLGEWGSIPVFFLIFMVLSFIIPSTSGFAGAVFPVIGPAFYAQGASISGAIASFSMANGLINIAAPSGAIFMSALEITKIPMSKYLKTTGWFVGALVVVSIVLLFIGQAINGNIAVNDMAAQNNAIM